MIPTKPAIEEPLVETAAPKVEPPPPHPHQQALRARLSTRPIATLGLLAAIAVVFVLELLLGGSDSLPVLSALGGLSRSAVVDDHQIWRLVSHSFVHGGFVHVAMNSWVLYIVGIRVEQMLGTARTLIYYTAAVIGGGLMTLVTSDAVMTVGASGGLFGLLAAESVFVFTSRSHLLPPMVRSARQRGAVINLMLNIGISLQPNISLSAHAGGAIVGASLMLIGFAPHAEDARTSASLPVKALSALALLLLVGGFVGGVGFSGALQLHQAPTLLRRDLPALGWSAEVPTTLAPHDPRVAPGVSEIVFGDISQDPALVSLARIARDDEPNPANDEAQLQMIEQALDQAPQDTMRDSVERTTIGEHPAVLGHYTYSNGLILRRLIVLRPGEVLRVETLVWAAFETAYADASTQMAESVQPMP